MAALTPRERILSALRFEETDIVPYHVMLDEAVAREWQRWAADQAIDAKIDNHLPFINMEPHQEWVSSDSYVDAFGSRWRMLGGVPHLETYPLHEPSLAGYTFPDLCWEGYFAGTPDFLAQTRDHFTFCGLAHGFFDRGWALRGLENFLTDFVLAPAFVEELLEALTEQYLRLIDRIAAYPFDGIRFADDWGYQRGVLVGADRWRRLIRPGLQKIFERARQKNLVVMVHADGDVHELIPDLIDMGVQILNPIQPETMDVLEIKRRYGKHLCLNGGVSSQLTLPLGSPEDVRSETLACLRCLGSGGGYVIGPTKSVSREVPFANTAALIETLIHQVPDPNPTQVIPNRVEALWKVYRAFHGA